MKTNNENYWRKLLTDFTEATPLPAARHHFSKRQTNKPIAFAITDVLHAQLKQFAAQEKLTLPLLLEAAWGLILARYTNTDDVVFGIAQNNNAILPVRIKLNETLTTRVYLQQFQKQQKQSNKHSDATLDQIQTWSELNADTPLVSAVISHSDIIPASPLDVIPAQAGIQFPLFFELREQNNTLTGQLHYTNKQFDRKLLSQLLTHYQTLLQSIIQHPEQTVVTLPILSEAELHTLLVEWNDTDAEFPKDKTIHQLFEEQVAHTPDNIAVVFEEQQLSYRELNAKANQLAHYLRTQGVKPETLVALCVERSLEMIIGILGILKAGGAYVPIDPHYPQTRIQYMLQDTKTSLVLTQQSLQQTLTTLLQQTETTPQLIYLDSDWPTIATESIENPVNLTKPDNLIYVIYTSGSTGKPKGVMIQNVSITNILSDVKLKLNLNAEDTTLSLASISFDIAGFELCAPLLVGAKCIIVDRTTSIDVQKLITTLQQNRISTLQATPSTLQALLESGWVNYPIEKIICTGEALPNNLAEKLLQKTNSFWNLYGPTETTIWATGNLIEKNNTLSRISIGKPITNTKSYIVDNHQQLMPIGVPGELCVSGICLARGYLYWPNYTEKKFITHSLTNSRIYKTGDLARWLPDGNLEYLGRIDDQIKIRGFRVELGEIEGQLAQFLAINQAVVIVNENVPNEKKLIAFFTCKYNNCKLTSTELNQFLKKYLPDYMLPSSYVQLNLLPLTSNGKIDKKALKTFKVTSIEADNIYLPPRTREEKILASIWSKILKISRKKIGISTDFFSLGGHSLLAIQIINKINSKFSIHLEVGDIFASPTIRELSKIICNSTKVKSYNPQETAYLLLDKSKSLPLSYSQKGFWFLSQLEPHNPSLNLSILIKLQGNLDIPALEKSLFNLIERHETLRTIFTLEYGEIRQTIISPTLLNFKLHIEDFTNTAENKITDNIHQKTQTSFNLHNNTPPIKAHLLIKKKNDYRLLLVFHHLITDGVSNVILIKELTNTYLAYAKKLAVLPLPTTHYIDFALQQEEKLAATVWPKQLTYWKKQLKDLSILNLPTDHARSNSKNYNNEYLCFETPADLTTKLKQLALQSNTTLFNIILSTLNILLARYSNQKDIAIGTTVSGRHHQKAENLIGPLGNILVLRSGLSTNQNFLSLLQQNKLTLAQGFANQDIPFEKLVEVLNPQRNLNSNPLYQVLLIFDKYQQQTYSSSDLQITPLTLNHVSPTFISNGGTKVDLAFHFQETEDKLYGAIGYNANLFKAVTIEQIAQCLVTLLDSIAKKPEQNIFQLPMLTQAQLKTILVDWNHTQAAYPKNKTVFELFEEQVEKTPDNIAVVCNDQRLTYQTLNQKANQLAHYLRKIGVKPENFVVIHLERSLEMIIAILGALKAGGAYIPIEPHFPKTRIQQILENSQANFVLTQNVFHSTYSTIQQIFNKPIFITHLDDDWKIIEKEKTANLKLAITADNLAYAIYTSGTTGKPKGVLIEHRALVNFLWDMQSRLLLKPNDSFLAITSISFDISSMEFYLPLLAGAKSVIADIESITSDKKVINHLIQDHNISFIQSTPTVWQLLINTLPAKKYQFNILCGGEVLPNILAKQLMRLGKNFWHVYGPTETTIWSTIKHCTNLTRKILSLPIGKPIANTKIYILNECLSPTPIGVFGEIYIGGDGLSRGYLNDSELTQRNFIKHPLGRGYLYKTGDLARWLSNGDIEFFGRLDSQIKNKGHRIEPTEIENNLLDYPGIKQATVLANAHQLTAYIVIDNDHTSIKISKEKAQEYILSLWQENYENVYNQQQDTLFNTSGWNSSYTRKPISHKEMKEWSDHTVERILSLKPDRVLEIGCGTGILLFQIAPYCTTYTASDFSQQALNHINNQLPNFNDTTIQLKNRMAHEFEPDDNNNYDTVILNSVIQYFPNIDYLFKVLEKALDSITEGHLFIGDVRSLLHLEAFHASVQLYKTSENASFSEWKKTIPIQVEYENELVIDPAFFTAFANTHSRISHVEIQLKRGKLHNEMTCFRYDVVLHIGQKKQLSLPETIIDYEKTPMSLLDVKNKLRERSLHSLALLNIPNARLAKILAVMNAEPINNSISISTVQQNIIHTRALDPEELWQLAELFPYHIKIMWAKKNPLGCFDAIFTRHDQTDIWITTDISQTPINTDINWEGYSNNPVQTKLKHQIAAKLRDHLQNKLPSYMVPSSILVLNALPQTSSGKIDKNALPILKTHTTTNLPIAPVTATENMLVTIWSRALNTNNIGIHDNFFDLGGDSFLALKTIARINIYFGVHLTIQTLFNTPIIHALANIIDLELKRITK